MKSAENDLANISSFSEEKSVQPIAGGHFGPYGGRYVAETLMPALIEPSISCILATSPPRKLLAIISASVISAPPQSASKRQRCKPQSSSNRELP